MENDVIMLKGHALDKIFSENKPTYGLIVSMMSLDRLWVPFLFASSMRKWDVQSKVRQCMDMMWDRIFEANYIYNKESEFIKCLDTITDYYMEDDDNCISYNYCFDNYLVNALYSVIGDFFSDPATPGYRVRSSACTSVLDLLSDYIGEDLKITSNEIHQEVVKEHILILSELERIDQDLITVKNVHKNPSKIRGLKDFYTNFEILPIKELKLKEI